MKSFMRRVADNAALYFFLGIEALCLLLAIGLTISSYLQGDEIAPVRKQVPIAQTLVITESSYEDFVETELEVFDSTSQLSTSNYKFITTSREEAINEFSENENAILILSEKLDEKEIAGLKINSNRLPLKQEIIDNSSGSGGPPLILIHDQTNSSNENQLTIFLNNNQAQDLVFQKFRHRSGKKSFRNS